MFDKSINKTTINNQLDLHVRPWTTNEKGTFAPASLVLSSCLVDKFKVSQKYIYFTASCVPNIMLISQHKWPFSKILFGRSTNSGSIGEYIRTLPFPDMVWVISTKYFHKVLTIYEVDRDVVWQYLIWGQPLTNTQKTCRQNTGMSQMENVFLSI